MKASFPASQTTGCSRPRGSGTRSSVEQPSGCRACSTAAITRPVTRPHAEPANSSSREESDRDEADHFGGQNVERQQRQHEDEACQPPGSRTQGATSIHWCLPSAQREAAPISATPQTIKAVATESGNSAGPYFWPDEGGKAERQAIIASEKR